MHSSYAVLCFNIILRSSFISEYIYKVGFNAADLVDNGETLVSRAARISPDYEGKNLYCYLDSHVIQWAKTKGVRVKAFSASVMNKHVEKASFRAQKHLILSKVREGIHVYRLNRMRNSAQYT